MTDSETRPPADATGAAPRPGPAKPGKVVYEPQSYWEIVWVQFKKYRLSFWALYAVLALVALAVYAPLIASDLPFTMVIDGERSFPWFANLFNKNYYENTVDIMFNSLIGLLPFSVGCYALVAALTRNADKRRRRRLLGLVVMACIGLVLLANAWLVYDPMARLQDPATLGEAGRALVYGLVLVAFWAATWFLSMRRRRALQLRRLLLWSGGTAGALVLVYLTAWLLHAVVLPQAQERPDSEGWQLVGWFEAEFPQPKEVLRRARAEGREVSATFPLAEYSFRGTTQDISAPPTLLGSRVIHVVDAAAMRARRADDVVQIPQARLLEHPFGTDNIGRDIFARMVFGTRVALTIGVVAVGIYITIGIILGALAGYFGGWVDLVILRFIEIMMCFPALFLIITLAAFVDEPSVFYVMLIIGLTRWTTPARLVRGEFLRLRNEEFVQAAKALGLPEWRIIFRHVLPNALGPVLVTATFGVASAILTESTISFLGLGDPSAPTWGKILNDGRVFRNNIMILMPGFAIFLTVSLFNLMGEGLRDALDPKLRR